MRDISRYMEFDVYDNLRTKSKQYNVTIDLENEVSSQAREAAIALTGAIIRNHYYGNLYPDVNSESELSELIKNKLNRWIPESLNNKFVAKTVSVGMKRVQSRA